MTSTQTNKFVIGAVGTMALLAIILLTLLYRGHLAGLVTVPSFDSGIRAADTEESFWTEVTYRDPFAPDAWKESDAQLASVGTASLNFFDMFFDFKNNGTFSPYRMANEPVFSVFQDRRGGSPIFVSNEAVLDQSSDMRTLGYSGQRKIVVDKAGNIIIGYRKQFGTEYQIFVTELQRFGGGYIQRLQLEPLSRSTIGITQRVPSLALDNKDILHLVWYGSNAREYPERRQIMYGQTKGSRNVWYENSVTSYVEGYDSDFEYWQEHPSISVGNRDGLYLVWEGKDRENEYQQIKFSYSFDEGDTWRDWENILPSTTNTFSRPTLVVTPDETLHIFAYSSNGIENGTQQIQYTYSRDLGSSWTPWQIVSSGKFDARHISATVVNGAPLIAYRTRLIEGGASQIVYQRVHPDAIGEPVAVYSSGRYQFFPSITSIKGTNEFCIAWMEEDTESGFPNEDPSDADIFLACKDIGLSGDAAVYNLTPKGSHLYPNLPSYSSRDLIPVVYYDDDTNEITMRIVRFPN